MVDQINRSHFILALILTSVAGFVDGLGFIHLNGLFVSFMSGNTTRLGVSLTQMHWGNAALALTIVGLFVIGATIGALIAHDGAPLRRRFVLFVEATLLALAALFAWIDLMPECLTAMVLAMGVENAVFQSDRNSGIGLTYMTGALVKTGYHLAAAITGGPRLRFLPHLAQWACLCVGAILGGLSYSWAGLGSLWIPSTVVFVTAWIIS